MIQSLISVVVGLLIAVCGVATAEDAYPQAAVDQYMDACIDFVRDERLCQCSIDHMQETMPYEEFTELSARFLVGDVTVLSDPSVLEVIQACAVDEDGS